MCAKAEEEKDFSDDATVVAMLFVLVDDNGDDDDVVVIIFAEAIALLAAMMLERVKVDFFCACVFFMNQKTTEFFEKIDYIFCKTDGAKSAIIKHFKNDHDKTHAL